MWPKRSHSICIRLWHHDKILNQLADEKTSFRTAETASYFSLFLLFASYPLPLVRQEWEVITIRITVTITRTRGRIIRSLNVIAMVVGHLPLRESLTGKFGRNKRFSLEGWESPASVVMGGDFTLRGRKFKSLCQVQAQ